MPAGLDEADAPPADAVEVAVIGEAWGVKGWFRVHAHAGDPQALFSSKRWFLRPPEPARLQRPGAGPALPSLLKIVQAKPHGDGIVAQAHEIADRVSAEALRGARVLVARASFPTADPGEYYWVDLIGLAVVNREQQELGRVLGLLDTGPQSVLRVGPEGSDADPGAQTLIPFVDAYIDSVSLAERRIVVDWGVDY